MSWIGKVTGVHEVEWEMIKDENHFSVHSGFTTVKMEVWSNNNLHYYSQSTGNNTGLLKF